MAKPYANHSDEELMAIWREQTAGVKPVVTHAVRIGDRYHVWYEGGGFASTIQKPEGVEILNYDEPIAVGSVPTLITSKLLSDLEYAMDDPHVTQSKGDNMPRKRNRRGKKAPKGSQYRGPEGGQFIDRNTRLPEPTIQKQFWSSQPDIGKLKRPLHERVSDFLGASGSLAQDFITGTNPWLHMLASFGNKWATGVLQENSTLSNMIGTHPYLGVPQAGKVSEGRSAGPKPSNPRSSNGGGRKPRNTNKADIQERK
jgi:hypothetical protein